MTVMQAFDDAPTRAADARAIIRRYAREQRRRSALLLALLMGAAAGVAWLGATLTRRAGAGPTAKRVVRRAQLET